MRVKDKYSCSDCNHQHSFFCENCSAGASGGRPAYYSAKTDLINHPQHYTTGKIETIEYIEDKLTTEMLEGYFVGNIIKYLSRYKHKNGIEDLKKARWYLNRMITNLDEVEQ